MTSGNSRERVRTRMLLTVVFSHICEFFSKVSFARLGVYVKGEGASLSNYGLQADLALKFSYEHTGNIET